MPPVDSYSQGYPSSQSGYMNNGYSQGAYGSAPVPSQSYSGSGEYDQSYQDYRYK